MSSVWEHRSQIHLHLTLFCVYASMRTRIKRKKVLSSLQSLFLFVVRVDPTTMSTRSLDCCSLGWRLRMTWSCPAPPRAPGFGVCVTPKVFSFFFDSKKNTYFIIGNKTPSRIFGRSNMSITNLSIPNPSPDIGGIPCSIASKKSSSTSIVSSSP